MPQNQNRFRALRIELIALVVLIPLALFFVNRFWQKQETPIQQVSTTPQTTVTPSVTTSPTASDIPTTTPKKNEPATTPKPADQTITLNLQGPKETVSYKISVTKKITVFKAMQNAQEQGLILKIKDYGAPLGILVEGINNIANDPKNQQYWTLYVNDNRSSVGASTATVEPGDAITWKFETTTL